MTPRPVCPTRARNLKSETTIGRHSSARLTVTMPKPDRRQPVDQVKLLCPEPMLRDPLMSAHRQSGRVWCRWRGRGLAVLDSALNGRHLLVVNDEKKLLMAALFTRGWVARPLVGMLGCVLTVHAHGCAPLSRLVFFFGGLDATALFFVIIDVLTHIDLAATVIAMSEGKYVLAVDLGSTGVRCGLVSHDGKIHGLVHELIHTDRPLPGRFEINPEVLFEQVSC